MQKIDISQVNSYKILPKGKFFAFKSNKNGLPYLKNMDTGRIYTVRNTRSMYPTIDIPRPIKQSVSCHRFFAECFIENPNPKKFTVVDHKDKDKSNYKINNLEWVTPSENEKRKNK